MGFLTLRKAFIHHLPHAPKADADFFSSVSDASHSASVGGGIIKLQSVFEWVLLRTNHTSIFVPFLDASEFISTLRVQVGMELLTSMEAISTKKFARTWALIAEHVWYSIPTHTHLVRLTIWPSFPMSQGSSVLASGEVGEDNHSMYRCYSPQKRFAGVIAFEDRAG